MQLNVKTVVNEIARQIQELEKYDPVFESCEYRRQGAVDALGGILEFIDKESDKEIKRLEEKLKNVDDTDKNS